VQNARTQVQQVESNTSLTPQQQSQQVRQIRQNARRQIAKVLTPQEQRALQQCQRQARANRQPADSSGSSAEPQQNL
jgi:Spy/CpxP family protein refolding chaperone